MMIPILIIAEDYDQAKHWAYQHEVPHGYWRYVDKPQDFAGYVNPPIVYVGTWYARKDAQVLRAYAESRRHNKPQQGSQS